jgi:hypothetical protein
MAFIELFGNSSYYGLWRLDRVIGAREFEGKNQIIIDDSTNTTYKINVFPENTVNIIESAAQKELAQLIYQRLLHQKWPVNYITCD